MYIVEKESFKIQYNFHIDRDQMIRSTIYESINIWLQWLVYVIRVWKCQFLSYALNFPLRVNKQQMSELSKKFYNDCFHFLLEMYHFAWTILNS